MMNNFRLLFLGSLLTVAVSCTKSPEKEVTAVLEEKIGKTALTAQIKNDSAKLFGKEDFKLKTTFEDYIISKTSVSFSDIKVEDNKATVKVTAQSPSQDGLAGISLLLGFGGLAEYKDKTIQDFYKDANEAFNKGSKKKRETASTSIDDMPVDKYEAQYTLSKVEDKWVIDENQKPIFNKKHLVK